MTKLPITYHQKPAYDILVDEGSLFESLDLSAFAGRRVLIVTDKNIAPLYAPALADKTRPVCLDLAILELTPGEEHKTLAHIEDIYSKLCALRFDRHDLIIALGGGVVGDMAGFAAATYMRGIRFIQIPTTLLSQTDSSIGGKTGVDFADFKNLVGAFYMPSLVYIHPQFLTTLPERQLRAGMGEIIKHALIKDASYAAFLESETAAILGLNPALISEMIVRSCKIKGAVVENDPQERGERALLNFGHTIGHALEKALHFELLHGECVALGAVAAAYISLRRGLITEDDLNRIERLFMAYGLDVRLHKEIAADDILRFIKSDKKMNAGCIRFVLLNAIGEAVTDDTVTDEEIQEALLHITHTA